MSNSERHANWNPNPERWSYWNLNSEISSKYERCSLRLETAAGLVRFLGLGFLKGEGVDRGRLKYIGSGCADAEDPGGESGFFSALGARLKAAMRTRHARSAPR